MIKFLFSVFLFAAISFNLAGQDVLRYKGTQQSNTNFPDGQLIHAIGVHNIQVMRANRQHPEMAEGYGWTYNHGPNLAYWKGKFYLNYLSTPHSEHIQPGQTLIATSDDGYKWSQPLVVFPPYKIPVGIVKRGTSFTSYPGMHSVMHQRMGFFISKKNRLFTLGYYAISFGPRDSPNDGNGIGRVICEVNADGTFGDICFIRYNEGFSEQNTNYPFYTKSKDKGFVEACNELLSNRLMVQQWREEADRDDQILSLHDNRTKAFCSYHLPDNRVVGLWKKALYSISSDEGKTWGKVQSAENVINGGGKFWGQKTSDSRYAIVYNPDDIERWPLAIMTSKDGLDYDSLLSVHGEISPCRYRGTYKDYGPQYIRGITEGNGIPPDGKMWVTYSLNKEDIWVSSISVPIKSSGDAEINDVFNSIADGMELSEWNTYSPLWAPVKIEKNEKGEKAMVLRDKDRYDCAKAERIFKPGIKVNVNLALTPAQTDGVLCIELQNMKGEIAAAIIFDNQGNIKVTNRQAYVNLGSYEKGKEYSISLSTDSERKLIVNINGKERRDLRFVTTNIGSIERVVFRSGAGFGVPKADPVVKDEELQIDPGHIDLPYGGEPGKEAVFSVKFLKLVSSK